MNLSEIATAVGLFMGVASFAAGLIAWYRGAVQKSYAAERDFNHLRRNQEQMSTAIAQIAEEVEEKLNQQNYELVQIKALLMTISARLGGSTEGFTRRE